MSYMNDKNKKIESLVKDYSFDKEGLKEFLECAGSESLALNIKKALEEAYAAGYSAAERADLEFDDGSFRIHD